VGAASRLRRALGLSLLLAAGTAPAAPTAAPKPLGCLIEPDRTADLGSQVIGVVGDVRVERGDRVGANDVLVTLRAEVETANARVAASRAQVEADVLAARANLDLAQQKLRRAEALVAQNFVSAQAVEQARGELEVARQKLNQSVAEQQISRDEHRVAEAQRALRTVRAPFAGVVVERFVNAGERVEEKPMLRVAVIDPLRVELMVPTSQYGALAAGDKVTIHPELPGAAAVVATVRNVDTVLDAASNSFRVRLTLPNPNYRLPAGLRCKAELPAPATAAAARPIAPLAEGTHALRLKLETEARPDGARAQPSL
jgi:RND family efflux transporter MFP subunit